VGIYSALQRGIKNVFPITISFRKTRPGEFDAFIIAAIVKSAREELQTYWAKTIGDTKASAKTKPVEHALFADAFNDASKTGFAVYRPQVKKKTTTKRSKPSKEKRKK
jgi:hypothetical protein